MVLTRGTVHETAIPKLAERQNIPIKFVFAGDHDESFEMLATGKADAFANDDVQLYGMLAETKSRRRFPRRRRLSHLRRLRADVPQGRSGVRRSRRARVSRLAGSREIVAIYERWFQKPLPSGMRLNLPMSPHLEELFRVQGLPSD